MTDAELSFLSRFGDALKQRRLGLDYSQADIGAMCGVTRVTITNIEKARYSVSFILAMKLIVALQLPIDVLLMLTEYELLKGSK